QSNIGQQLEFQPKSALFPWTTVFVLARSLVHRCFELRIAATTASAASNDQAIVRRRKIVHNFARVGVINNRADGNFEQNVFALAPGFVGAFAVTSALCLVFRIKSKMHQRVVAFAGFHDDIPALATIAAGGTTARDKLLPAKGEAAVATVAGFDSDYGLVDEHVVSGQ